MKAGDRCVRDEDFAAFVAGSSLRLLHVAMLLTGERHRAEDLVQAALMNAYVRWDRIVDEDPYGYVRRAVVNGHMSWWRRFSREVLHRETPEPLPAADGSGATVDREVLQFALAALTARERRVVVLRYVEDLSERQVADELGVAVGTVKSTAARGLSKLRAAYADLVVEEEA